MLLYQFRIRLDSSGYYFRESITLCFRSTLSTSRNAKCERKNSFVPPSSSPTFFLSCFSSITSLRFIARSISNRNRTNVNAGRCNTRDTMQSDTGSQKRNRSSRQGNARRYEHPSHFKAKKHVLKWDTRPPCWSRRYRLALFRSLSPRDVHAVSYPSGFLLFHYAQSCLVIRLLNVSFYLLLPRFTCVTIICLRQWLDVDVPFFLSLCMYIFLVCMCVCIRIYIQCFIRFHNVLFVVYYQFVSLYVKRENVYFCFICFLCSVKDTNLFLTMYRFLIDVFLVLRDIHVYKIIFAWLCCWCRETCLLVMFERRISFSINVLV